MMQHENISVKEKTGGQKMLISENGKLIELPDDIRAIDNYKIYENTLVVYYAEKGTYSIYDQQTDGLKLEAENLKKKPRFFESGFILFEGDNQENVLYNTKDGESVAIGNFRIGEHSNLDVCKGNSFRAVVLKFYENGIDTYRVFDDRGNEVLDAKYVGEGKKVELLDNDGLLGNIMPLRIRVDRFHSDLSGILHIVFWDDGSSEVIEVIPPEYGGRIHLDGSTAVKDCYGKLHYPTYVGNKGGKEVHFAITGKRIRLPK